MYFVVSVYLVLYLLILCNVSSLHYFFSTDVFDLFQAKDTLVDREMKQGL